MIIVISSFVITLLVIFLIKTKRWKNLIIIGIMPSIFYIIYFFIRFIYLFNNRMILKYPIPSIGGEIHNWVEELTLETGMILMIVSPFILLGLILVIVSYIKIKKEKQSNNNGNI